MPNAYDKGHLVQVLLSGHTDTHQVTDCSTWTTKLVDKNIRYKNKKDKAELNHQRADFKNFVGSKICSSTEYSQSQEEDSFLE